MDPVFDECGEICGEKDEPQNFYCDECPMKLAQDDFERDATEWLDQRAKDKWQQFGFPRLLQTVLDTYQAEMLPVEKQTVRAGRLIQIKNGEIARLKRIDAWQEKLKRNSQASD